jgi:hypothetical protein
MHGEGLACLPVAKYDCAGLPHRVVHEAAPGVACFCAQSALSSVPRSVVHGGQEEVRFTDGRPGMR